MQTESPCKLILQQNWVRRVELEEKSKMRFIHCHLLRDQFLMVKPALNTTNTNPTQLISTVLWKLQFLQFY